jgi:hypothetical protein
MTGPGSGVGNELGGFGWVGMRGIVFLGIGRAPQPPGGMAKAADVTSARAITVKNFFIAFLLSSIRTTPTLRQL